MAQDDLVSAVVTAPLTIETPAWTSDDIARYLGVSQSRVARVWRTTFDPGRLATGLPNSELLRLVGAAADPHGAALALRPAGGRTVGQPAGYMRSAARPAWQTLLAVEWLARTVAPESHARARRHSGLTLDLREGDLVVCTAKPDGLPTGVHVLIVDSNDWQALLPHVVARTEPASYEQLLDAATSARRWAAGPTVPYLWEASSGALTMRTTRLAPPRSTGQVIANQVFEHIVRQIDAGQVRSGERIFESSVARSLHTTRNQTRDALRQLASSGLVSYTASGGFCVPVPSIDDVVDIYTARSALGSAVARRAAAQPNELLASARQLLRDMAGTVNLADARVTGNADLAWQDELATCSGMRSVPQMMHVLSGQLRIYIAVMGLAYTYPIHDMVSDNEVIMAAVDAGDGRAAARAWQAKLQEAHKYMATRIEARPLRGH